ncbi:tRNA (N6-isopentenyl adenosine(37)-C2)-methylthiotransferase MiaB [Rickettsiales endosymbiont of Peranema trichophorum]|uniref:tRNA (N6-isopentenyl adenosine(37)-C2)-methylthiotransferase MiaB n=1 Tax=Rickettsiales endosymbiont of Peranema trichophorum TaxID=2486577 RepID=UPI001023B73D|nr:tRNA (N6-isopentenyl adenosine(37)-C2)-methylthiotransferase MiaB [Rickettsiales endosymbiont of Peranema trichophorum]RZI47208.1 tRNA (N6-isopentenyl adenosine(37)-C2)-methylthiotransferase MiaB [Rickettsiales endosymbiont of Peranema trichophorum]
MKKLYIKTYGCQMNVYDSAKMEALLKPHGFVASKTLVDADLVLLNTCHIREKAAEKVYSQLGKLKKIKEAKAAKGQDMMIVVAGCVAQAEGEEIARRAGYVDIVVGPQSYHNLPELIETAKREKRWVVNLDFPVESKFDFLPEETQQAGPSVFLTVQEGCNKFCHFCCVPFTRGAEYSRTVGEIYREAVKAVAHGAKEITLLGQNVSAYRGEGSDGQLWSLGKLIHHIARIKGLNQIRYTTSHPVDMLDDELLRAHSEEEKLMPFLHLPVQSGSDRILKLMNRKHTKEYYIEVIERYRSICPDIAFSSDFIVGYPGESDKDFEETLDLVKKVKFAQSYSFKYSPRLGTPAAVLQNQVPEEIKEERLAALQALLKGQQVEFNEKAIGTKQTVLVYETGKHPNQYRAKSRHMQNVVVEGYDGSAQDVLNTFLEVEILKSNSHTLFAKPL